MKNYFHSCFCDEVLFILGYMIETWSSFCSYDESLIGFCLYDVGVNNICVLFCIVNIYDKGLFTFAVIMKPC
jgi:hypothetical protein